MKTVYFFGTGYCAKKFANKVKLSLETLGDYRVLGFLDNDTKKIGTSFLGIPVYNPVILKDSPSDLVLLFLMEDDNYNEAFNQLSQMLPQEQIQRYYFPLRLLVEKRYRFSENVEIKETLNYILKNKLSVFNQYITEKSTYDEVKWDNKVDLPYVDFTTAEGRIVPMYYPRNYKFLNRKGILFVENLMWEQSAASPHLYVKQNHNINDGDCIIDAGTCEGNFALRYAEIASHIYIFEMDPIWRKPLEYTFRKYQNKVTIIDKMLSDKTTDTTCKIDDIVLGDRVDFIKMDIEGAESDALIGAERTLCKNDVKASICSYHRNGDEEKIRLQLEKYGYETTVSNGYMLFIYSDDTWKLGDLRRGIVYGDRKRS